LASERQNQGETFRLPLREPAAARSGPDRGEVAELTRLDRAEVDAYARRSAAR
jgi:hypothetical protein